MKISFKLVRFLIFVFAGVVGVVPVVQGQIFLPPPQLFLPPPQPLFEPSVPSSSYEEKLSAMVTEATIFFQSIDPVDPAMVVILDIDNTVVDTRQFFYRESLTYTADDGTQKPFPLCSAIPKMLELYRTLLDKGFKVIFLTSRRNKINETDTEETLLNLVKQNLIEVGYTTFEKIICMDYEDHKRYDQIRMLPFFVPSWKAQQREKIAKEYKIIATFDDDLRVLSPEYLNTGRRFIVPGPSN